MEICVVGAGYVGLSMSAVLAEKGHRVICVDVDKSKISSLQNKTAPFFEPGLEKMIRANMTDKNPRLSFSSDLKKSVKESMVVFICVGTPALKNQMLDVSYVERAVKQIAPLIDTYKVIVMKSTVPVGTCAKMKEIIKNLIPSTGVFDIVSNPEFMREGYALQDILKADRIVIGTDNTNAAQCMLEIYESFENRIVLTDLESSEMIKLASNAFLATKISFINSIATLCEKTGANVDEVTRGMGYDSRIGEQFLHAGIGYGGSCFPKDIDHLISLGNKKGCDLALIKAAKKTNGQRVPEFVSKIETVLGDLKGKKVAVWGLSFKPETDDIRYSKALETINTLKGKGALISAHDPVTIEKVKPIINDIEFTATQYEALINADALVIATEWPQYVKADLEKIKSFMKRPLVFDGRNIFDPQEIASKGIEYYSVGRKSFINSGKP